MLRKSRRFICTALVLLMITSSMVACEQESTVTSSGNTNSTASQGTSTSSTANEERRTLTVELFDRGVVDGEYTVDNNPTIDFIVEEFGEAYNADVEFLLIPRSEEEDKLSVLMASNSAPDLCFTYNRDLVFQFAAQEGLAILDEYYAESPTLQAYQGDNIEYGMFDGQIVAVPGKRAHTASHVPAIRQDWLDATGLEVPTTTEEWYNAMVTFKEEDPGNLGENNYPFLIPADNDTIDLVMWSFVDPDLTEEEDFTLPYLMLPGWKEGMQFMNQLYNEGLINPEFALDQNDTMYDQALSTGAWGSTWQLSTGAFASNEAKTMYKNVPESEVTVINPFVNEAGETKKPIYPSYSIFNFVPAASDVPDLAVQYLEWLADEDVGNRLKFGIEGTDYVVNEDGVKVVVPDAEKPEELQGRKVWNGTDFYPLDASPDSTYETEAARRVLAAEIGYLTIDKEVDEVRAAQVSALQADALELSLQDGFVDNRAFPSYQKSLESVAKYQTNLDKIYDDGFVKIVTAPVDEFEATYQEVLDQYLQSGGQDIIDEKTAYYKELNP